MHEGVQEIGAVAQLGEHLLCKQGVNGSIPFSSTKFLEFVECKQMLLEVEFPGIAGIEP